jgi:DNA polymerase-3 subunit delta
MSTYLYFGENEFFLSRTIKQLKTHTLDQQWSNFNYTEYPPESKETIPQALSDILTPPVGSGRRLVHLLNSTLMRVCSKVNRDMACDSLLAESRTTEAQRTRRKEN